MSPGDREKLVILIKCARSIVDSITEDQGDCPECGAFVGDLSGAHRLERALDEFELRSDLGRELVGFVS